MKIRNYYGCEKHKPQNIFLSELHKNLKVREKISKTNKYLYANKLRKPSMLGHFHSLETRRNHSIRMKLKYSTGELIPHNKGKTKEDYEPLKRMSEKISGNLNSSKRKEVREKISIASINRYLKNPESHPNKNMKNISNPQKELFFLLQKIYLDVKLNYPIICKNSVKYADVAIPLLKIDFEYDEPKWHNKEKDKKRDKQLKEIEWDTFRITPSNLKQLRIDMNITKKEIKMAGIKNVI
jgi:hypothetical protein